MQSQHFICANKILCSWSTYYQLNLCLFYRLLNSFQYFQYINYIYLKLVQIAICWCLFTWFLKNWTERLNKFSIYKKIQKLDFCCRIDVFQFLVWIKLFWSTQEIKTVKSTKDLFVSFVCFAWQDQYWTLTFCLVKLFSPILFK